MISLVVLIIILFFVISKITRKGISFSTDIPLSSGEYGEKCVADILARLPVEEYKIFNDVYIQHNGMSVQIDHLAISKYGVFVIETKNYNGTIFGYEDSDNWTQYLGNNKYLFKNPIKQNKFHVLAVKNALRISESAVVPIIVFIPNSELRCQTRSIVVYSHQLLNVIQSKKDLKFRDESIEVLVNNLNNAIITHENIEIKHIEDVNKRKEEYNECLANMICPRCKGKLVERQGRYGKFIGCSNYPYCKFTKHAKD